MKSKRGRGRPAKRNTATAKAEKAAKRDILSAEKLEGLLAIRETWALFPKLAAKAKPYLKQLNKRIEKHTSAFSLATSKG